MPIQSYDPRITRLGIEYDADDFQHPVEMDQLETYEVFTEVREGKGYSHVGIMHGADERLAFLEAKEQYGRRGNCFGVWVIKTNNMHLSPYAKMDDNIFNLFASPAGQEGKEEKYHVFLQKKRGKQHDFLGEMEASPENILYKAAQQFGSTHSGCNLWYCKSADVLKSTEEDKVMWATTKEKTFREALIYKIKDRIDAYNQRAEVN